MKEAPSPVRLIGNATENFYILGKKHYAQFRQLQKRLYPELDTLPGQLKALVSGFKAKKAEQPTQGLFEDWLKAYCDGLEVPLATYLAFLDKIEKEALPGVLPGCTSVFLWHEDLQRAEHLRLLDWPLAMAPETTSELIYFQAPGQQTLLMICVPGLPFLPLTLMNEAGVTLALHAKYHSLDHPEGTLIGKIAIESMLESRSIGELKKHLKRHQTKRLWGLQGCDPSGQVLAMDVMGPQMDGQSFEIRDEKILVFNNAALVKNQAAQTIAEPPAFAQFCRERRRWCLEKLKTPKDEHALVQLTRASKTSKFGAPAVTLCTLQALSLHPGMRRLELLLGAAPVWAQGELAVWDDLFATVMRRQDSVKFSTTKEEQLEWPVRREFALAQKSMDLGDVALGFHHIQMGLVKASGELRSQASWVWAWWQWRHLDGKRDRLHLPPLVRRLLAERSSGQEHLKFLLFLLELELNLVATISPPDLNSPFREWADAYLLATPLQRLQLIKIPQARLDIQDCLPLHNLS